MLSAEHVREGELSMWSRGEKRKNKRGGSEKCLEGERVQKREREREEVKQGGAAAREGSYWSTGGEKGMIGEWSVSEN